MNVQGGLPGSCNSADSQQASETLKLAQRYAETIQIGVAHDGKDVLAKLLYEDGRKSSRVEMRLNHLSNFGDPKECTPKPERALLSELRPI